MDQAELKRLRAVIAKRRPLLLLDTEVERLLSEVDRLREALEYYSVRGGCVARAALDGGE